MSRYMKMARPNRLPDTVRREIIEARHKRGWSQAELGRRVGLPQMHISGIGTGKVVPRFDRLLDLVRVLDRDLLMVPRAVVPAIQALIRDHRSAGWERGTGGGERPLYALDEATQDESDEN
jgi:transcriptional regulator with XRE-family HTH domain